MALANPIANQVAQQSPNLDEANRVFQEGLQLFQQGTAESLGQAIRKLERAATLFRQAGGASWGSHVFPWHR